MAKISYITAYQFYHYGEEKTAAVRSKFLNTFQKILEERIPEDIEVKITNIEFRNDERLKIELEGAQKSDLKFVSNIFKEITGQTYDSNNVPKKQSLFGQLRSVGKVGFGLFVDVGIETPVKEVLIPLFRLRVQLLGGKKLSTHEISKLYGFIDNFPVEIEVTKMEFEKGAKPKFEGKFTDEFLEKMRRLIGEGLEIVFTTGESRQMVKRTLAKRGHTIDIAQIERIGPLETAIQCHKGTSGPGILSHIGPFLSNCRMSVMRPQKLQKYWNFEE
ncbi:MAG: DUF2110 family protein [Promethearchaeota archaeon]